MGGLFVPIRPSPAIAERGRPVVDANFRDAGVHFAIRAIDKYVDQRVFRRCADVLPLAHRIIAIEE